MYLPLNCRKFPDLTKAGVRSRMGSAGGVGATPGGSFTTAKHGSFMRKLNPSRSQRAMRKGSLIQVRAMLHVKNRWQTKGPTMSSNCRLPTGATMTAVETGVMPVPPL